MTTARVFAYHALRRDGTRDVGSVQAVSRDAALALLQSSGMLVTGLSPASQPEATRARATAEDLALGFRSLATLLNSGIPVGRALAVLEELAPGVWQRALPDMRSRVERGEGLAASLAGSDLRLPEYVIGMIQAGEAGSDLARSIEWAAQLLEERAANRASLRNALAYPVILVLAGSASVALLAGLVLPRFVELLAETGQTPPATTRLLLGAASIAPSALVLTGVALAIGGIAWRMWVSEPGGRERWQGLLLAVPGLGSLRRSGASANGCAVLAALLESGVPLARALPLAGRATGDYAIQAAMAAARRRIELGEGIASAFHAESALTPTLVRLARIGEETARLSTMLAHGARLESARTLQRIQSFLKILEPVLILLFGGLVMFVAAAVMQAMYSLRP